MPLPDNSHDDPLPRPGPVADPGQAGEYVVGQLLNHKVLRGRTYYLVLWQGHASTDRRPGCARCGDP